jgi:hypothetical protein
VRCGGPSPASPRSFAHHSSSTNGARLTQSATAGPSISARAHRRKGPDSAAGTASLFLLCPPGCGLQYFLLSPVRSANRNTKSRACDLEGTYGYPKSLSDLVVLDPLCHKLLNILDNLRRKFNRSVHRDCTPSVRLTTYALFRTQCAKLRHPIHALLSSVASPQQTATRRIARCLPAPCMPHANAARPQWQRSPRAWRQRDFCGLFLRVFSEIGSGADPSPPQREGVRGVGAARARASLSSSGLRCTLGTSASASSAGRNLLLLGIWLEHVLKNIPFHDHQKEFTDKRTNAHVPELCLEY